MTFTYEKILASNAPDTGVQNGGRHTVRTSGAIIWAFYAKSSGTTLAVAKSTDAGATWSTENVVTGLASAIDGIACCADNLGNPIVAFTIGGGASPMNVYSRAGGSWTAKATRSYTGNCSGFQILCTEAGVFHLLLGVTNVAVGALGHCISTDTLGTWGAISFVQSATTLTEIVARRRVSACLDSTDKIHCVWYHRSPTRSNLNYATYPVGGPWSAIATIHNNLIGSGTALYAYPWIAVDVSDIPHVVCSYSSSFSSTYFAIQYTNRSGGSWAAFTQITPNDTIDYTFGSVGLEHGGSSYLAFVGVAHTLTGTNDYHFQISYGSPTPTNVGYSEQGNTQYYSSSIVAAWSPYSGGRPISGFGITMLQGTNLNWFDANPTIWQGTDSFSGGSGDASSYGRNRIAAATFGSGVLDASLAGPARDVPRGVFSGTLDASGFTENKIVNGRFGSSENEASGFFATQSDLCETDFVPTPPILENVNARTLVYFAGPFEAPTTVVALIRPRIGDERALDLGLRVLRARGGDITSKARDTAFLQALFSWDHISTKKALELESFFLSMAGRRIRFYDWEDRSYECAVISESIPFIGSGLDPGIDFSIEVDLKPL